MIPEIKKLKRWMSLAAALKENLYPNCESFSRECNANARCECSAKTVQRDIKALKEYFHAPIEFSYEHNGYYLTHHGWNFECPILEENQLVARVLSAKIAEDIAPNNLRDKIIADKNEMLTQNNPNFLDSALIKSFFVASGLSVSINPEVFESVFNAWVEHRCLKIKYRDSLGQITNRIIEPHALVYLEAAWFIRANCHERDACRTFAVHRILETSMTEYEFTPDSKLIDNVIQGELFDYPPVKNILLECEESVIQLIEERPIHSKQKIKKTEDKIHTVSIPLSSEYALLRWIFNQQGRVRLLEPLKTKNKIAAMLKKMLEKHS